jgi:hypothetical protein
MSTVKDTVTEVLHHIKVKLYPNYLPAVSGAYIARTNNEAALSVEDVCAAAKNRGGFTGSYEDLVRDVKAFFNEAAYQLADGYAVNTGWYSLYPKISGTFSKPSESIDPQKHRVDFAFRPLQRLRSLADKIKVEIEGVADVSAYIDEILDVHTGVVNEVLTPGGMMIITGSKIKISGDAAETGVWLYQDGPEPAPLKITENLGENASNRIIATVPALETGSVWRVRIVTQFTSGTVPLKTPRILEYPVTFTVP